MGGGGWAVGGQWMEGAGVAGVTAHTGLTGVNLYQTGVDCIQDDDVSLRAGHLRGVVYDNQTGGLAGGCYCAL